MCLGLKIVFIIALAVLVKAALNTAKLSEAKRLRDRYKNSLKNESESFSEYIPRAKKLFSDAGLSDVKIPAMRPVGYDKAVSLYVSLVNNLGIRRSDFITSTLPLFDEMVGVFKMRLKDSVSPRYWIEIILFLPQKALSYIGFKENALSRFLQIVYWFSVPLLVAFRSDIYEYITELLSQVQ